MRNGILYLAGLLVAFLASWGVFVLGSNAQLGSLVPYYDENEGNAFPLRASGLASQGERVYMDLGCVSCHTQQVRRPDYGADQARGWGERQSVARDYIFQNRPQLGSLRFGPDLSNLGARKPSPPEAAELMKLLYAGSRTHPSYAFLFEDRRIVGERSQRALKLEGRNAPRAGHEIVPTSRADALVAYLLSLNQSYQFPEARPVVAAAVQKKAAGASPATEKNAGPTAAPTVEKKSESAAAQPVPNTEASPRTETSSPPGKRPEQAIPAAAPDEKKSGTEKK